MLQRLNTFSDLDEEILPGNGFWLRDQLLAMDAAFVAACERAFALGLESRAAARATISFRNGKAAAIEGAIEGAWAAMCGKRGQMSAVEIIDYVRARCGGGVDVSCIRFGIEQRLRQRGATW
jgi:hypothetical protein